jgi:GNAT superfamily N-acetyltransferase
MPDMLVKLYDLPDASPGVAALRGRGINCRRAEAYERTAVLAFARAHFPNWIDEIAVGFGAVPPTVYVAVDKGTLLGFACYNVTRPNFFGPTGVDEARRKEGIGRVLLLQCLDALRAEGYAYAIIGGVGPAEFYQKAVAGTLIPGSEPGIYRDRIRPLAGGSE